MPSLPRVLLPVQGQADGPVRFPACLALYPRDTTAAATVAAEGFAAELSSAVAAAEIAEASRHVLHGIESLAPLIGRQTPIGGGGGPRRTSGPRSAGGVVHGGPADPEMLEGGAR